MGTLEETDSPSADGRPETPHSSHPSAPGKARRPYAPPRILVDGDVRSFVLGGSLGTGDSGNTTIQKP